MKKKVVLILGMHRSGTSLLAQLVRKMGVYLGEDIDLQESDESNEDGYFEYKEIVYIHDAILDLLDNGWNHMQPLLYDIEDEIFKFYCNQIKKILVKLSSGHDVIGIKDPRMCLFLPLWEKVIYELDMEPKYLYTIRNGMDVASSMKRRDGMPLEYGIQLWKYYNVVVQKFLYGKEVLLLHFEQIMENFHEAEVSKFLFEDKVTSMQTDGVIKKKLRHFSGQDLPEMAAEEYKKIIENAFNKNELECLYERIIAENQNIEKKQIVYQRTLTIDLLKQRNVVIYGAGKYGIQASELLRSLGISSFIFCDCDKKKIGTIINGVSVKALTDITNQNNVLMIITVGDIYISSQIARAFPWMKDMITYNITDLKNLWKQKK